MMPSAQPPPSSDRGRSRRWGASPALPVSVSHLSVGPARSAAAPLHPIAPSFESLLADFTALWERGKAVHVEDFLVGLDPPDPEQLVELIYREYCLADAAGLAPTPAAFLARFPAQQEGLGQLFGVDDALRSSQLRLWCGPGESERLLQPEAGDEIGPYLLVRELGRGGFARVFLAEQADLDDRLVVVKVSTQITTEPRLLARARHPNIVEVLWHGLVDDGSLQVLCLPFLGGTTLASVLTERRRLKTRPTSGRDLLDDLDRVSAPEFPPPGAGRPARELLSHLSYAKAATWIVARLAEALDFAYSRGVLHGDVKPSNVLLTAESTPMLLDFNLAVGWRPSVSGLEAADVPDDVGGTLAYMAPERLRLVAESEGLARPSAADRHRADVYALGVVLLELLTGRPPELRAGGQGVTLKALASAYFTSRLQGAGVMIRAAHTPVPAGLRSILEHCLAVNPADRYRRASELAEDLDRWRSDRALVYAPEPVLRTGLVCWVRRQRRALTAALLGVAVTAAMTAVAVHVSDRVHRGEAIIAYQIAGTRDSGAFSLRRQGTNQLKDPGDQAEIARRHLQHFGLFRSGDWREGYEFRNVPESERDELEAWLLEQALRFGHALGERPDSPDDWRRAALFLDEIAATRTSGPIESACRDLRARLPRDLLPAPRRTTSGETVSRWMELYLAGVESELKHTGSDSLLHDALDHYRTVLQMRPSSFWARYRAAAVCFALGDHDEAVAYLGRCVERYPGNSVLRLQYAGCLWARATVSGARATSLLEKTQSADPVQSPRISAPAATVSLLEKARSLEEAAAQYDRAQDLDPDFSETYLSRAFLRMELGQADEFLNDLNRFEVLAGLRRRPTSPFPSVLDLGGSSTAAVHPGNLPAERPSSLDPDEVTIRVRFANFLARMGRNDLAVAQTDRALALDPDHLLARYTRAVLRSKAGLDGAGGDVVLVAEHPDAERLVGSNPDAVEAFLYATNHLLRTGRADEALRVARRGAQFAARTDLGSWRGVLRFNLAQALLHASNGDPSLLRQAFEELDAAHHLAPAFVREQVARDPAFDVLRKMFGALASDLR